MKLSIGFSPCPNDTFIFDALVNGKIDTEGFSFEPYLEDVETLNQWAQQAKLDITKLSFPAFFQSVDRYHLLKSGSALGKGVGPLLVSKLPGAMPEPQSRIALPGAHTTAHLLFSFAYPGSWNKKFILFSKIEDEVLEEAADLGVIIHENRFTYEQRGLHKVMDLGTYWEDKMKVPIPLGGIAIRRSIDKNIARKVESLVRKSLEYAFAHDGSISNYVRKYAQTMSEEVMRKHIDLYVNTYSLDLGKEGRHAIEVLREVYLKMNPGGPGSEDLFL